MKLYSRKQVLLIAGITGIVCVLFCAALFVEYRLLKTDKTETLETVVEAPVIEETVPSYIDNGSIIQTSVEGYTQEEIQNISVYEKCQEGVVNITTSVMAVNWFYEPVNVESGSGSGIIIDKKGYVVTNRHVVENANKIYISLSDGTQYEGKIIGSDVESDIAVVKFTPPQGASLTTISFGDSTKLKVGQKVIAIGNPFGFDRTMTTGIVSSLGRPVQNGNYIIRDMIQTDTAINPGNSGGPLLDTQGRMIGINTTIYTTSGSSSGIGFAVPVNTVKRVVAELIQNGKVTRGRIDARIFPLTSQISYLAKTSVTSGLLVSQLVKNGRAEAAGIRGGTQAVGRMGYEAIYGGGDVITAINGIAVSTYADYYSALESKKPGDTVNITIARGMQTLIMPVVLAEFTE